jgi:hypothetical protein
MRSHWAGFALLGLLSTAALVIASVLYESSGSERENPQGDWTEAALPYWDYAPALHAVIAAGSRYVVVGEAGFRSAGGDYVAGKPVAAHSEDGVRWSTAVFEAGERGGPLWVTTLRDGLYALGGWLQDTDGAITSKDSAWYSVDGHFWGHLGEGDWFTGAVADVVEGPDGLVAVGEDFSGAPVIIRSRDGTHWMEHPVARGFESSRLSGIVRRGDRLMAYGYARQAGATIPLLLGSTDGDHWKEEPLTGMTGGPTAMAVGKGRVVAEAEGSLWWSEDGRRWVRAVTSGPGGQKVFALTWTGDRFVAVGSVARPGFIGVWTSPDGERWLFEPGALDLGSFGGGQDVAGVRETVVVLGSAPEGSRPVVARWRP